MILISSDAASPGRAPPETLSNRTPAEAWRPQAQTGSWRSIGPVTTAARSGNSGRRCAVDLTSATLVRMPVVAVDRVEGLADVVWDRVGR